MSTELSVCVWSAPLNPRLCGWHFVISKTNWNGGMCWFRPTTLPWCSSSSIRGVHNLTVPSTDTETSHLDGQASTVLSLRATHIPGIANCTQRGLRAGDWCLNKEVSQMLLNRMAAVDLGLRRSLSQGPWWCSCPWLDQLPALCLPSSVPHLDNSTGIQEMECRLLLIGPHQRSKPWFPLLLLLVAAQPCPLPSRRDVLS